MKINQENISSFLRKRAIPLFLVGGLILTVAIIARNGESTTTLDQTPTPVLSLVGDLATPTLEQQTQSSNNTLESVTDSDSKLVYFRTTPPSGYEGWDCFTIPAGGNAFRAILYGGDSQDTRYDTPEGAVFLDGPDLPPVLVNVLTDVSSWPAEVSVTQPGDIGCSQ